MTWRDNTQAHEIIACISLENGERGQHIHAISKQRDFVDGSALTSVIANHEVSLAARTI